MFSRFSHSPTRLRTALVFVLTLCLVLALHGLYPDSQAHARKSLEELKQQLDNQEERLEEIEEEIEAKKAGLEEARENRAALQNYITDLEAEINAYENKVHRLQGRLDEIGAELDTTEENLRNAEAELARRIELAGRRVRALQENGTVSMLEVLVDSSSFSDFLTRFSYLQQMLRQDVQLLHEVKDEKARIETEKAQLEEKRANVASLKAQAAEQLATIAAIRDKKASQLAETTEEIEAIKQQLEELDRISQEVQDRLQKLEQEYDEELKRRGISFTGLEWPLPRGGWISSPYGPRFHPILHEWKQHTGVDVAIGQGTPIYAAAAGKVIYAGWLGGYGNTVIIAHGKGTDGNSYSTLYAHGSALYVKKNTFVKQGQRIASVGSTGYSTGPHLHLEVRVNGEHKNPLHYISKP